MLTKCVTGSGTCRTINTSLLAMNHGASAQVFGVALFHDPTQGRAIVATQGDKDFSGLTVE